MGKKHLTLAVVAASIGLVMSADGALADTYIWTATTIVGDGSGTFTTSGAGAKVSVTGISGLFNGAAITGLTAYAVADQLLFPNSTPAYDQEGISFTAGGVIYNLSSFQGFAPYSAAGYIANSLSDPSGNATDQGVIYSFTATRVPEPGAWALMLVGFGGLGVAMRTRRRGGMITA